MSHFALLNVGRNHKTIKGDKKGVYLTGIMYLAPAKTSGLGINVCPHATPGCMAACLFTAGHGTFSTVRASRVRKTQWFVRDSAGFLSTLVADIERLVRKSRRENVQPAVRLNGTSDIGWETIPVVLGGELYPNLMAAFPEIIFYDYTKNPHRKNLPDNYQLIFSLAESNEQQALKAIENGMNLAVVFRKCKYDTLPKTFWGLPVIDGDDDDLRFLDPAGVVVGLKTKGKAYKDQTGFVRELTENQKRPRKERARVVSLPHMRPVDSRPCKTLP